MAGQDDCIKADLNCKNQPNRLFIEDALDDDNSVVRLSPQTMDKLELFCGDAVKLKGKKRRETVCIVLSDDTCRDDRIKINHVVQNNLRVHSGDVISIQECQPVKYGTRIHVLPIDDTVKDIAGNLLQDYLQPYFLDAYRPVCVGDTFIVRMPTHAVEFQVIKTEPSPYCIVAPKTIIDCDGEPIEREVEKTLIDEISFDDIGGLEDVKQTLKEFIQYAINYSEIHRKFGIAPSRGVLLYGPPDCGKTMLAKALANECDLNFISINCHELLSMLFDNIEDNVRKVFDKARQTAPCILFIDELDCVYRLDQIIYVPLPDEKSRQAILKIVLQKYSVAKDVDLTILARNLVGLSGGDITGFCRRAYAMAVRELIENEQKTEWSNPYNDLNAAYPVVEIQRDHFEKAMKSRRCFPSSDNDIRKYEMFTQMWPLCYGYNSQFSIFNDAQNIKKGGGVRQESTGYTDDDDLYG